MISKKETGKRERREEEEKKGKINFLLVLSRVFFSTAYSKNKHVPKEMKGKKKRAESY